MSNAPAAAGRAGQSGGLRLRLALQPIMSRATMANGSRIAPIAIMHTATIVSGGTECFMRRPLKGSRTMPATKSANAARITRLQNIPASYPPARATGGAGQAGG
jgi:hypothetical protein